MKLAIIIISLILLFSCSGKQNRDEILTIRLDEALNQAPSNKYLFDDIKDLQITPLETRDSSLLSGNSKIIDISNTNIIIESQNAILFFDRATGNFLYKFENKGRGPMEYSIISNAIINAENEILIYDIFLRKLISFSYEGVPQSELFLDSIVSISKSKNGALFGAFSPNEGRRYLIGLYDENYHMIEYYVTNHYYSPDSFYENLNKVSVYNGKNFIYLNDTLFLLENQESKPYLTFSKGKIEISDVIESILVDKDANIALVEKRDNFLVNNNFFISYTYDNCTYYDVWDIEISKLLYRTKSYEYGVDNGIKIQIDGKIIHVWPNYIKDNKIYCFLDFEKLVTLYPDFDINDNQMLLEFTLK